MFVLNKSKQVVGTLTDGDIRRALIKGYTLSEPVDSIMNQNFKYLTRTEKDYTSSIKSYRADGITILPLLDSNNKLVKVYNLNDLKSILPIDAVLMAGGKENVYVHSQKRLPNLCF